MMQKVTPTSWWEYVHRRIQWKDRARIACVLQYVKPKSPVTASVLLWILINIKLNLYKYTYVHTYTQRRIHKHIYDN